MESVERRLQRTLAAPKLWSPRLQQAWARWVLSRVPGQEMVFLVDETALGPHLKALLVGLAYQGRCIPLGWGCYGAKTPGQVKRMERLRRQITAALLAGGRVVVQAARGIGTSPALVRVVRRRGWT
jgi:hypothetical protein